MSAEIRPFHIDVPEADLADLRDRLTRTRWPARLPGAEWSRGIPVDHLRELAEHWRTDYDWRRHEAELNRFPQFRTEIDGQEVHFLHVVSPEPDALPVILTHSWPNSVAEFLTILGPLTDPRAHGGDPARAVTVVAPSLPGFAFSPFPEPADDEPWSAARVARAWSALMSRLGYRRYGAHGNDVGALVSAELALADPEHLIGVHLTGGLGMPTGDSAEIEELTEEERDQIAWLGDLFGETGSGYARYLARRPQTLAYGLHDSPAAQLAYLLERFTEFDGWPAEGTTPVACLDRDQFLTTVSLYWFTGTAASSAWTYFEDAAGMPIDQTVVPTGVSHGGPTAFRRIAERGNTIVRWSNHTSPSHMVAMADPENLVADLRQFFGGLRAGGPAGAGGAACPSGG
ncbi:pimeloyl-ACP methyl ester carboxylesterase [Actinoalloteichus hoggarensis]|uniref:Uncharacterized protein n=1 Tax=Actinoalloteichus hoggarensis TaxID=1470176 RepID=A0A221W4A0_9PSEU|nr:epoxide hydrolase [Actinoalloteichus hoggarensis]ASO20481.1 hypothetical protein AHOG_14195 [Actinoalloteichus hoggarensis]MBB5923521.1 pimeloyl-ACP methyl ester carboxylesterase [Actinoalloteichus hoggarensis]